MDHKISNACEWRVEQNNFSDKKKLKIDELDVLKYYLNKWRKDWKLLYKNGMVVGVLCNMGMLLLL